MNMFLIFQLHAEYDFDDDEYAAHRVSQAFEMSQFIKLTSSPDNCDLVLVGGDFNVKPESLGFQIIQNNGQLLDSWITKVVWINFCFQLHC